MSEQRAQSAERRTRKLCIYDGLCGHGALGRSDFLFVFAGPACLQHCFFLGYHEYRSARGKPRHSASTAMQEEAGWRVPGVLSVIPRGPLSQVCSEFRIEAFGGPLLEPSWSPSWAFLVLRWAILTFPAVCGPFRTALGDAGPPRRHSGGRLSATLAQKLRES